jgi:predicted PurR-regulated permease PerM
VTDLRAGLTIVGRVLLAYAKGQLIVALVVGLLAGASMAGLGLPFAPVLGGMAGILTLIPLYGNLLSALPSLVIALWQVGSTGRDPVVLAWVVLVFAALYLFENLIVTPRAHASAFALPAGQVLVLVLVAGILLPPVGPFLVVPGVVAARDLRRYRRLRRTGEDGSGPLAPAEAMARVLPREQLTGRVPPSTRPAQKGEE